VTNTSRFFVIIAASAAAAGSPAFAQSLEPKAGPGSALTFSLPTAAQQSDRTKPPALDLVPHGFYDTALTGYSENLRLR
jgi:hypothetical protein